MTQSRPQGEEGGDTTTGSAVLRASPLVVFTLPRTTAQGKRRTSTPPVVDLVSEAFSLDVDRGEVSDNCPASLH